MNRRLFYIKEDNAQVQDFYVGVIADAYKELGYEDFRTIRFEDIKCVSKRDIIIAISHYAVCKLYLKGFRNLIYWVQGSSSDESYMRNKSYLRKSVISLIEFFALSHANGCFMVSQSMLDFFNEKYRRDYSTKTYLMPCFNSNINDVLFETPNKYKDNIFCYVGSLSPWQCFIETVDLFNSIQKCISDAQLLVLTGSIDEAKEILKRRGVNNYEVKCVPAENVQAEISKCKFGFIIRKKSPVNYVATPTKLSNYLSAGVIPIVSDTVGFFKESFLNLHYSVVLSDDNNICDIIKMTKANISPCDVLKEYKAFFDKYYSTKNHIESIKDFIISNKLI